MKKLLNKAKPIFILVSKISAGLFILAFALLIVLGAGVSSMVDNLRFTDQVAMLAIMFALIPTVSQFLSLIDRKKVKVTSSGHCSDCNKDYKMTTIIENQ